MPFCSIVSRPALGIIWSYYGDSHDVSWLMQRGSHRTRAYFVNSDLLKGFLVRFCPVRVVERASEQDRDAMRKHLVIHFERVIQKLRELETIDAKIKYLQELYPSVAYYVMR